MKNRFYRAMSLFVVTILLSCLALTLFGCSSNSKTATNTAEPAKGPLAGKTMIFLGSSVTYGFFSNGVSFVDFLKTRDGVNTIKEAVSGTTLVDNGETSYIQRMLALDTTLEVDAFICQLSTNDASQELPLGEIATGTDRSTFDTSTITGAMEYIIAYARETWGCPVIFYTGTRYDSPAYEAMVNRLLELQEKWDIGVLDLWNSEKMNAVSQEEYNKYMGDSIHPTRNGYCDWWLPEFEAYLDAFLNE